MSRSGILATVVLGAVLAAAGRAEASNTFTTVDGGTPTTGSVPEPALLSLLGLGLTISARRLRRSAGSSRPGKFGAGY